MKQVITLTKAEFEAVRWAVGNFSNGDNDDVGGNAIRNKAMKRACSKIFNLAEHPVVVATLPQD